jgi:hypothetical protein
MIRGTWHHALFAALAVLFVLPAVFAPAMTHDSFWIDVSWSQQFTALLREGNLYPRWLPWSYGGLGSPAFYYYAPLSFYLAGLFGLIGLPTYGALLAAFGAAWFASGVTMHAWLKGRTPAPLVGALLYMVLPYHVMDFYGRGALAEFCAFAIVPLVAIGVRHAIERERGTPLACAYAALIMTHLPTALIVSLLLIAPYALWLARANPKQLFPVARGVAGGIAGAAIYLVPALTLQSYSSVGALWDVKFLKPANWSLLHPDLWVSRSYVLLFAGLAAVTALAATFLSGRRWSFWTYWSAAVCLIVAGLVPGFWSLPVIKAVQFPWRALLLAEFGLATIAASWRGPPVVATLAVLPLLMLSLLMASPANPMHGEPMQPLPIPGLQDVIEYLPPGAVGAGRAPRNALLERAAAAYRARPGSVFPFPSLIADCANGTARLTPNPASPLVMTAPPGCQVTVRRLPVEMIGFGISLLALIAGACLRLSARVGTRRGAQPPTDHGVVAV